MRVALLLLLLLVLLLLLLLPPPSLGAQLTVAASTDSVSQQSQVPPIGRKCSPDEYWTGSSCCKLCPAEEEVMRNCTVTSDQMCQCQTSHFYRPPDSPEECRPCSTCPNGTVVLQKCNSTADTVCGPPPPVSGDKAFWFAILFALFICICFGICYLCKKPIGRRLRALFRCFSHGAGDAAASTLPSSSVSCSLLQISDQSPDSPVPTSNSVLPEDTVEMVCEAPTLTTAPESPAGVSGFPNGCHGERRPGPGLVTTA
ncbi:tumor necrosis factor receptor superfamily member 22-like isoform X3 [Pteropus medius]|uniref:tumor necrosis factor receptor superfamily member 22-like isoform X3 n=1 Tax=Pteropus vampyrus TaxID=132908 RepID=UPI00196A398D|nr:tumor necrosis factor receptor superfamily member 22-like isoform X3 [Pteropus giganteus]XP_039696503.1 tumor necrosis factor receptor superfamily member 22-like isoform X3 [Pteropus giganteus]